VLDGTGILLGAPGVGDWKGPRVELLMPSKRAKFPMAFYPLGSQKGVAEAPAVRDVAFDPEARRINFTLDYDTQRPTNILLRNWQMAELGNEIETGFDHDRWPVSPRPVPLGEAPYGWYRTVIRSDRERTRTLILKNAADAVTVFLNVDAPRSYATPLTFQAPIRKGDNVLAILVKNWGRYRLHASYDKPLDEVSGWGLLDDVTLDGALVSNWRRHDGMSPAGRSLQWGEPRKTACPVRWFRATFKLRKTRARPCGRAVLRGLTHGSMWLNGRFVGLYLLRGFDSGHGYYLPRAWLRPENTLIVLDEGGGMPEQSDFRFDRDAALIPMPITFR
jgi:hypothetical protein